MKDQFVSVCNDREMAQALDFLEGTILQKLLWMEAEGSNWGLVKGKLLAFKKSNQAQLTALYPNNTIRSFIVKICNDEEMAEAVDILGGHLFQKLWWMAIEGSNWDLVKQKIVDTKELSQRRAVYNYDILKKFFLKVCNNKEMAEAVGLLGGTLVQKLTWMYEEGTNADLVIEKINKTTDNSERSAILDSQFIMKNFREDTKHFSEIMKALVNVSALPTGKIQDAVAELAGSAEVIDQNTAKKVLNGTIVLDYLDNLAQPPNANAILNAAGLSSTDYSLYIDPATGKNFNIQNNFVGTTLGNSIFGWKRLSVDRWKILIVHETSHSLNADNTAAAGSFQRYAGEFRSYWVAEYRKVEDLDERARLIKARILGDYLPIKANYDSNPAFKAKVDAHTRPTGNTTNR